MKTFSGKSSAEALAKAREALGDEACVVETRRTASGVEVVAVKERAGPSRRHAAESLFSPGAARLAEDMIARGFSQPLAEQIAAAAENNLDPEQLDDRIASLGYARQLIALWIGQPATALQRSPRPLSLVALVGSPGVGKTTTLAKIAARSALAEEREVVLASCDTRRLGGAEQLAAYARVLGLPFHALRERRELDRLRAGLDSDTLLLVDTPGIPRQDRRALDQLADLLAGVRREEITLLLAADRDAESLAENVRRFAPLRPGTLAAARADETARGGALVTALARARLPISLIACGPDVPDDLAAADPLRLAAWSLPLPGEAPVDFRSSGRREGP